MRHLLRGTIPALLVLAACAPTDPVQRSGGGDAGAAAFGSVTRNNLLVQIGQVSYAQALSSRFAGAVPTTINFAFNSATLDAEARAALDRQADFILQFPEVRFAVYGHTDLVGTDAYNQQLGLRRAQAAVAYLTSRGISPSRLEALVSRGETQPLIATQAPERANRRTVTDVTGFVGGESQGLNGKYAEIVFRDYVQSAGIPETTGGITGSELATDQ
jgi:outer membrane protein OmpA-like peptidoglycan-associated protein